MAESELFERGLQARRDVLGAEYVDASASVTVRSAVPGRSVISALLGFGLMAHCR
jgi:hypothetical protein